MINFMEVNMRLQSCRQSCRKEMGKSDSEEVKAAYRLALAMLMDVEELLASKEALYLQEEAHKQ